jgi:23S rRNA (cytidine1920-2'-O)/16S rRNA (cytidine1409-2'-O)-methyltransferase
MVKYRLDVLLVEKGFYTSREKAKSAIMEGRILVNKNKIDKAGTQVAEDSEITVIGKDLPYVSRGGYKLEKAIKVFDLPLLGAVMADIGASTGGFTDCALQNGVAKVYAVDVGYGQLAWSLRTDDRVIVLEKTNARYLSEKEIPEQLDLITIDASFISLTLLLPTLFPLLKDTGHLVALIKPQFEAGKDKVGKKGVVRDPSVHIEVINKVIDCAVNIGFSVLGLDYSPIKGPEGNIEYLLWLSKNTENLKKENINITEITLKAVEDLSTK